MSNDTEKGNKSDIVFLIYEMCLTFVCYHEPSHVASSLAPLPQYCPPAPCFYGIDADEGRKVWSLIPI